jgi:hypothetical protein
MNAVVLPAMTVDVCEVGVAVPATGPNVTVYVPGGTLRNKEFIPAPEYVAGPVIVNVADAEFVETAIVPVAIR